MSTADSVLTFIASGIGLEMGRRLVARGHWRVYLLDINTDQGHKAAAGLGSSAKFLETNVAKFEELRQAFSHVFDAEKRLNFVFANAGIIEKTNFFEDTPEDQIQSEIEQTVMEVNLQAAINTSRLALRFFRLTKTGSKDLVVTGSVGSLYPCFSIPMYAASKREWWLS